MVTWTFSPSAAPGPLRRCLIMASGPTSHRKARFNRRHWGSERQHGRILTTTVGLVFSLRVLQPTATPLADSCATQGPGSFSYNRFLDWRPWAQGPLPGLTTTMMVGLIF